MKTRSAQIDRASAADKARHRWSSGRISEADFVAFKLLEARTGKKQSEPVREAVRLLLEHNNRSQAS